MSDEESFVVLGSSPMPSIESDGINDRESSKHSYLQSDTPGSRFTSLKNSQIIELQNATDISTQTPTPSPVIMEQSAESKLWSIPLIPTPTAMEQSSHESKLWSRPPVPVQEDIISLRLEDCAIKPSLHQSLTEGEKEKRQESVKTDKTISTPYSLNKSSSSVNLNGCKKNSSEPSLPRNTSIDNNLASSFIMGEVNADVLKSSVYSQFPSISMEACAEDVVKLQNMYTEYIQLKSTLQKVNNTMKLFYNNSMQWKEKMNDMESHYKQQLNECQNQIEMLRIENQDFKQRLEAQYEQTKAIDVARQKDREETIQEISEKNALMENMRAQIVKLEHQQLATFEIIPNKETGKTKLNDFEEFYVTRGEHELKIKDLERQLSELLASNLDAKDVEKQYIDELNCLKVNLTSAEEIIKKHTAEIAELRALDLDKQTKIEELEITNKKLCATNAQLNERIVVLEQQNDVHRKDFEMERDSRQTIVGEKQQILQDLRALQKKNQELIEDRQNLVESYERKITSSSSSSFETSTSPLVEIAAAAQTYYVNNPQRPIRVLPSSSESSNSNSAPLKSASVYRCPICNKAFKSLNVLQSHVNDCIDKN